VKGVLSDGEETIRSAVAFVFPQVPHQLCQFHYLKDAIKPFYEADRHAKTLLKKQLRGVRPIERALEEHPTPENDAIRDYCLAVRASLTDDGRSPLEASGLHLYDRITQVSDSIARVQEKKIVPSLKAVAPAPNLRIAGHGAAMAAASARLPLPGSGQSDPGQSGAGHGSTHPGKVSGSPCPDAGRSHHSGATCGGF
jgi:hypothetical protein